MSKADRYRAALAYAGLKICYALNGLEPPNVDIDRIKWAERYAREALDVINAALEEA